MSANSNFSGMHGGEGSRRASFGRVISLVRPEAGSLIIATLALLIAETSRFLVIKFGFDIARIVSGEFGTPEQKSKALLTVYTNFFDILPIVVAGSICTAIRAWLFSSATERFVARVRKVSFSHLIHQEIAFFDVTRAKELKSRLSEEAKIIKKATTVNLSKALSLRDLLTALVFLVFIYAPSWKLTLLVLAVVLVISGADDQFVRYARELSQRDQAAAAVASSIAEEAFGVVGTLRSSALEEYSEKVDEKLKLGLKLAKVAGFFFGGLSAASTLSIIVVVFYGATLTIKGSMTRDSLALFILYSINSSFYSMLRLHFAVIDAAGAGWRVIQLLDSVSSMPESRPLGVEDAVIRSLPQRNVVWQ